MRLIDGRAVDRTLVQGIVDDELGADSTQARALFDDVALGDRFVEFLTLPGYELLD